MKNPVIGFISPFWLPIFGGAEQYHSRLASALQENGLPVRVFCGVSESPSRENGSLETERHTTRGDIKRATWRGIVKSPSEIEYSRLASHYEFIDSATNWAKNNGIEIALIGNPFNGPDHIHARELYKRLSDARIKVGLIHHDLPPKVSAALKNVYIRESGGWENATKKVVNQLKHMFSGGEPIKSALMIGSPLFFEPDFIITNTDWSSQLIDPRDQCLKLVLHPLMEAEYWQTTPSPADLPLRVDVTMVNPQSRKNPQLMANFIALSEGERKFRVLKGGWGNSFEGFNEHIKNFSVQKKRSIEFVEYAADMRSIYHSTKLLLFPSFEEGYGMTPVEAMYCGVPVLSSNYPAIVEAVGDAAYSLCPFREPVKKWISASDEMLSDLNSWKRRSLERSAVLSNREVNELQTVVRFLRAIG